MSSMVDVDETGEDDEVEVVGVSSLVKLVVVRVTLGVGLVVAPVASVD